MLYRAEIDGLRAIAVMAVILGHTGFRWFSGGYVGVDIFFVISGYLIASIILTAIQNDTFSFAAFYERRARRLLPALFVMIIATIGLGWAWLTPDQFEGLAKSVIAVTSYTSNLYFLTQHSGYFTDVDLLPLLHTWSLGIEEQFYFIFPLFIVITSALKRHWFIALLAAIFTFSFALAQLGGNLKYSAPYIDSDFQWTSVPSFAFYMIFTRMWEFLIGTFTAIYILKKGHPEGVATNQLLSMTGLAMVLYAIVQFNELTPSPSIYTLIPAIGTFLIILFATPSTMIGRVLSIKPMVFIGLISYSAYLWHQPIFVFARLRNINEPTLLSWLLLIALTIIVAYISYRFVEQPFRRRRMKRAFSTKSLIIGSTVTSFALISFSVIVIVYDGIDSRFDENFNAALKPVKIAKSTICDWQPVDESVAGLEICKFGDAEGSRTVVVYGDSHASALIGSLDEKFQATGIQGIRIINHVNCNPIPLIFNDARPKNFIVDRCRISNEKLLSYASSVADDIIVAIRWTWNFYPIPDEITSVGYDNGEGGVEQAREKQFYARTANEFSADRAAKKSAIYKFIDDLDAIGRRVFLIYPIPEVGWDVAKYNYVSLLNGDEIPKSIDTSFSQFNKRNMFVLETLNSYPERPNIIRIRPSSIFCDTFVADRCVAQLDGIPFYYDADHLSYVGATMVTSEILKHYD